MGAPEAAQRQAVVLGAALLGRPVDRALPVSGGRNSRVFLLETDGGAYALKQYRRGAADPRDRQGTEADALALFAREAIGGVPRLLAMDRVQGCSLLTWIDGDPCTEVNQSDLALAAAFLGELARRRGLPEFPADRLASEACLSGAAIAAQIAGRCARLEALDGERELAAFLDQRFRPALAAAVATARRAAAAHGIDFDAALAPASRRLCPADFGFHNCIRRPDGSLAFVDFEYFGWDDPVKLSADFLLHPAQALLPADRQRLGRLLVDIYSRRDSDFRARLEVYTPLFALRWVLILLNDFIADRWLGRLEAGAADDWRAARSAQLAKAEVMLAGLAEAGWR